MNTVYFIADTHFGHKNIITMHDVKPHRPFESIQEHDEALVDAWNSTVNKKDTVWHLGDFSLGGVEGLKTAGRLNGFKKLVLGNHDTRPTQEYLEYFTKLYGAAIYKNFVLTHIPVHPNNFPRFDGNIHGHLHSENEYSTSYFSVSVEKLNNFKPISFEELYYKWRSR